MTRTRDRRSQLGLLPRMEAIPLKSGGFSYRYHPVGAKPIPLGRDRNAAIRKVLDLTGLSPGFGSLRWVWERYTDPQHPAPRWKRLSPGTQEDYLQAWKELDRVFGAMPVSAITPPMVARYVNVERARSPRRAVIEKALLSNLCRHAITLGVATSNPTMGVETPESEPRTQAPEPEVLQRFLGWLDRQTPQRRIIGMAAEYASLAGSRRVEFLDLTWPQVDIAAGVVRTKRAKQRGKKRGEVIELVEITPRLADVLQRLLALRAERSVDCLYVFPTRDNNCYSARGFKTLWQRCMQLAMAEGILQPEERFTFHDLRAFYTTVHKRERGELPDLHADPRTTARVYDRNKFVRRKAL